MGTDWVPDPLFSQGAGFDSSSFCPYFFNLTPRVIFFGLSSENSYFYNLAGFRGLQRGERLRNMRPNVIEIIRRHTDNQNSYIPARYVLLIPYVLVYRDEDVKLLFSQRNQLAVLFGGWRRRSW